MRRIRYLLLFVLGLIVLPALLLLPTGLIPEKLLSATPEPGRVKIVNLKKYGKTIATDQRKLLRGGAVWIFKYAKQINTIDYIRNPSYWQQMSENGLNAVRIICFDPWQQSEGYIAMNLDDPKDVESFLSDLDAVVNLAAKYGMYAVINYHDIGRYQDCAPKDPSQPRQNVICQNSFNYITKFWKLVAPRYKDRTHVIYEIANEPVSDRNGGNWFPHDFRITPFLQDQKTLYDLVRSQAPQTHIILLSFANTNTFGNPRTMKVVADDLSKIGSGINWSNASVGFHPYSTGGSSKDIRQLMARYPVVNTEQNFPPGVTIVNPDEQKSESMDGDLFGVQTMERLGISWFHWKIDNFNHFQNNYINVLQKDAQQKRYFWKSNIGTQK